MSVSDGQKANALNFNAAYLSRKIDTDTVGRIDLLNSEAESGASIVNVQRELNGQASFVGDTINGVKDRLPAWISNVIGLVSDTVKARVDAIQAIVESNIISISGLLAAVAALELFVGDGDISQTGFTGAASQTGANIGGLVFDSSKVLRAEIQYLIDTGTKVESGRYVFLFDGTNWASYGGQVEGVNSGITIDVNPANGQAIYDSGAETFNVEFKATTFNV